MYSQSVFLAVVFAVSNRENKVAAVKIVAAVLFVSFLCLFVQMVTDSSKEAGAASAFQCLWLDNKAGGGIIGGLLEQLLCPNFGVPGTYVIDIIVLIISLVLITERSIMKGKKAEKSFTIQRRMMQIRRMDAARERRKSGRKKEKKSRQDDGWKRR